MKVRNKVKAKMANTFKKMVKKHKKKKLMAERNKQAKEQGMSGDEFVDDYERRLSRHKRNIVKRTVAAVVTIAVAVTAVGFYIEKRSYHTYKVVQTSEQEDIVSTNYVEMDGNILRYSPDGVSLVSDKMSTLWSETYQNFEQVRLPNQQEVPEKPNPHAMLDLNRFMADELAGFVNMQADILRRHIHKDQWITTNLIPIFNPVDPVRIDHPDFLTYTRYLVTGHNQGIGSQGFRMGIPEDLGFSNDQFRNRVGKAFGVMELQPGQVNWGVYNPQPLPGAIRMWVYHVFAGGGKFVCNYRFRQPLKGSEQYHYGMIMTDGVTLSPGGEEYVRITQEMKKLRAAYDKKNRMPGQLASRRIGLLFDMSNYWEMEFQRQTDQWRTMAHVHKYYNLLKSFAAPVDVISEKEDFSGYPFLIAPAYQLLDNKLVERWTEYVKKGGHLILTCRTGQKDRDAKLWEAPLAAPIHQLAGINSLYYDHLPHSLYGKVDFGSEEYAWNNWADVLTPAAGTAVWAVYTDQFYKGAASVIHRRLGKGTVTYIGTDTDDGKLEKEVVRRVYMEAGVPTEDLPYGVVKEWRDGFYIALNYTSDIQEIVIPDEAEVLIGSARLEPAGVVVWKEKSDNKHK